MADPRHQKLAEVIVNYSLELKADDKVVIAGSPVAMPLIRELYREAVRTGAYVYTDFRIGELDEIFLREASDAQLTYVSERQRFDYEFPTALISILSAENNKQLSGIDPKRIATFQGDSFWID